MCKKICILGSTGSIGKNALKVAEHLGEDVRVVALAAKSNIALLEEQALLWKPLIVAVYDLDQALALKKRLPHVHVVGGIEGIIEAATHPEVDFVLSAISGAAAVVPTLAAIESGKEIGLANKEALVCAGELVMGLAKEKGVRVIPIDSEHNALFQCLHREKREKVGRLILTASGGPFREYPQELFSQITLSEALKHPNYQMGGKITIDSSTLMNKGLEVIEAHWLFDIPVEKIEVLIHPQQFVHSLIEFVDGSILAQLSEPNMIFPIQYALTFPEREKTFLPRFDFSRYTQFEFMPPDMQKFPCLRLAYEALKQKGTMPCFMNAANEKLVERFMQGEIHWQDIPRKLEHLMQKHSSHFEPNLETLLAVDTEARQEALCC